MPFELAISRQDRLPKLVCGCAFFVLELSDLVILSSNITQIFFCDPEGVSFTNFFRGLCFGLILCGGWWGGGGGGGGAWDCLFSEIHTFGRPFSVLLWILSLASFCRSWKIRNLEIYVPVGVVLVL